MGPVFMAGLFFVWAARVSYMLSEALPRSLGEGLPRRYIWA